MCIFTYYHIFKGQKNLFSSIFAFGAPVLSPSSTEGAIEAHKGIWIVPSQSP